MLCSFLKKLKIELLYNLDFPGGSDGTESACGRFSCGRPEFNPWVGKILWRREWQPPPVFLPGESHEQRISVGCSSWGHKELDTTERLLLIVFPNKSRLRWFSPPGSCLHQENKMDGWAVLEHFLRDRWARGCWLTFNCSSKFVNVSLQYVHVSLELDWTWRHEELPVLPAVRSALSLIPCWAQVTCLYYGVKCPSSYQGACSTHLSPLLVLGMGHMVSQLELP